MRDTARAVVIGGGVGGCSILYWLARLGWDDVVLVERADLTSGSTFHSAGLVGQLRSSLSLTRMMMESVNLYRTLEAEVGLETGWREVGSLRLASSEERMEEIARQAGWAKTFGLPLELVSADEAKRLFPPLSTNGVRGAAFLPTDGYIDPSQLTFALAEGARRRGAELYTSTRVTGIRLRGGRVAGILTERGEIEAEVVVNAGGPWAMEIGELLGAPLPLVNQVNEVIRVRLPAAVGYPVPMVQEYIPGEEQAGYFRQDGPGSMIAGVHTYAALAEAGSADPDDYRDSVAWGTRDEVARRVGNRLQVEGLRFEPGWAGLYPVSADGEYVVGPYAADPTIVACGGFSGQGLIAAISVGPAAAEWIVFGEPRSLPGAAAWLPDRPGQR